MIYLDTSVVLAQLFDETRHPDTGFWDQQLVSSRLIIYEVWITLNARGVHEQLGPDARSLLARTALVELTPPVLARALEPFPHRVRTLDALHLSTALYLREYDSGPSALATYDRRLADAALALGVPVHRLD